MTPSTTCFLPAHWLVRTIYQEVWKSAVTHEKQTKHGSGKDEMIRSSRSMQSIRTGKSARKETALRAVVYHPAIPEENIHGIHAPENNYLS